MTTQTGSTMIAVSVAVGDEDGVGVGGPITEIVEVPVSEIAPGAVEVRPIGGVIKWFDVTRGFGFAVADGRTYVEQCRHAEALRRLWTIPPVVIGGAILCLYAGAGVLSERQAQQCTKRRATAVD